MKTVKFFFLFALTAVFVSCSEDDSPKVINKDNFVGTYKLDQFQKLEVDTTVIKGAEIISSVSTKGNIYQVDYNFGANDTVSIKGSYTVSILTKVQGEITQQKDSIIECDTIMPYSLDVTASKLTLGSTTYQLNDFNGTSFTLKLNKKTDSGSIEKSMVFSK